MTKKKERIVAGLLALLLLVLPFITRVPKRAEAYTASEKGSLKVTDIEVSRDRYLRAAAAHVNRANQLGYGYNRVLNGTHYKPLASSTEKFCCVDLVTHVVYTATASRIKGNYRSLEETLKTEHAFSDSNGLVFNTQTVSVLGSQLTGIPALYKSLGSSVSPQDLQLGDIVLTGDKDGSTLNHSVLIIGPVTAAENTVLQIPNHSPDTSYFISMSSTSLASYRGISWLNRAWYNDDPNKGYFIKAVYRPLYEIKSQDLGGLRIKKADAGTKAGLTGAEFELTGPGDLKEVIKMTASEYTSAKKYPPGTYTLTETKAPAGYILDSNPRTLTIGMDEINSTYWDQPIPNKASDGRLQVIKKDKETGETVAGAVFDLSQDPAFPKGKTVQLTTGKDGTTLPEAFQLLLGDTVYVREVSVPAGYVLDSAVKSIKLKAGADVTLEFKNDRARGRVKVIKKDKETGETVAGAVFDLSQDPAFPKGKTVQVTTGKDGATLPETFQLLLGDTVYVREVSVPAGYVLDSAVKSTKLKAGADVTLEFENDRARSRVKVIKKDKETGETVAGAVFDLSQDPAFPKGKTVQVTTGKDGTTLPEAFQLLLGDTVYVREVSVPAPYLLDSKTKSVKLVAGADVILEFKNDRARGRIEIHKTDGLNGKPVQGAVFEIRDDKGELMEEVATNKEGRGQSGLLPLGSYQVREKEAEGYVLDDRTHKVELLYQDMTVELVTGELSLDNQPIRGRIRIIKRNLENEERIAGAEFLLFDQEGKPALDYEGQPVPALVSNEAGEVITPLLRFGSYLIRETEAPEEFYINEEDHWVVIEKEGKTEELTIWNQPVRVRVRIRKTDRETGEALAGAVFQILDPAGLPVTAPLVTDEAGEAESKMGLPAGDYQLIEIEPPPGYSSGPVQFFSIDRETGLPSLSRSGEIWLEVFADNKETSLLFSKRALTGSEELPGALLQILDKETGEILEEWISGDEPHQVRGLEVGKTYILREVTAPLGFCLAEEIEFVMSDSEEEETLVMRDAFTRTRLLKKDAGTGEGLPGVPFEIEDQEGELLHFYWDEDLEAYVWAELAGADGDPLVWTGKKGVIDLLGIPEGNYLVGEVQAPAGYLRHADAFPLVVTPWSGEENPVQLVIENKKTEVVLRKIDKATGRGLAGAQVRILDDQGKEIFSVISDEEGWMVLEGLDPGTYRYKEHEAPEGYLLNPREGVFTLDEKGQVTGDLVLENEREVIKTPSTGEGVPWHYLGSALLFALAGLLYFLTRERRSSGSAAQ